MGFGSKTYISLLGKVIICAPEKFFKCKNFDVILGSFCRVHVLLSRCETEKSAGFYDYIWRKIKISILGKLMILKNEIAISFKLFLKSFLLPNYELCKELCQTSMMKLFVKIGKVLKRYLFAQLC